VSGNPGVFFRPCVVAVAVLGSVWCQVAFYVESYALKRMKVAAEHTFRPRNSLNLLCSRRERKALAPERSVVDMEDWCGLL
jgi:hypothetical protein